MAIFTGFLKLSSKIDIIRNAGNKTITYLGTEEKHSTPNPPGHWPGSEHP